MPNVNYTDKQSVARVIGYDYNGSPAWRTGNGVGVTKLVKKVRTGTKWPWATFRSLRDAGLIPSNNLLDYTDRIQNPPGPKLSRRGRAYQPDGPWLTYVDEGPWGKYWDGSLPGVPYTEQWFVNLRASATLKAKLKAVDMKVNVAQFIAEYSQTRNMIASTAVSLAKAFSYVRHGQPERAWQELTFRLKFRKVSFSEWKVGVKNKALRPYHNPNLQITKQVSDSWLALQYGWLPLISDVTSAAELLAQHMSGHPIRMVVKASAQGDRESGSTGSLYDYTATYGYTESIWTQAIAKTGYVVDVTNPDLATLAQTGLDNPLLLAWELLPYSFVVDWFFKIGDYLQALSAFRGVTIRDRWSSLLVTTQGVVEYNVPPSVQVTGSKYTTYNQRFYIRSNSVVDPVFHINKGTGLNLTRFGNALALLNGVFGRGIPRSNPYLKQSLIYS